MSSKTDLLRQAIQQVEEGGDSKFDDERLTSALASLPEAEDAIIFFDGEQLFEKLHGIGDFIKMASGNNEEAARVAGIIDAVIGECEIIDYSVSVEYTEGNHNRTSTLGKLSDDAEGKLLFKALAQGEPFESWQSWAPADADAYSLTTGVNLHVLYEGILEFVRREVPESAEALDQWEQVQHEIGVNLDQDILQSFSGESVSITLPAQARDGSDTQHSVTALECTNPERVRELLHKGFEGLNKIPAVQAQQLKLAPCEGLEGFEQLQSPMLMTFGAAPVVGFNDGWMMFASNAEAVQRVLAVRKGEAASIAGAESLEQFDLNVEGTVYAVKYTDIAKGIHQAAQAVEQIGAFLPMAIGMAGANASPEDLKPIQEVLGLLPSVANVIRKFDFMEKSLTVTREGPAPMTYVTDASMIIREPETR